MFGFGDRAIALDLAETGAIEPGDFPPVLDVEVSGGLATADVAAAVRAWVAHITARIHRARTSERTR